MFKLQLPDIDWVVGKNVRIEVFPVNEDASTIDLYLFTDET
jgi:hypothetical protein